MTIIHFNCWSLSLYFTKSKSSERKCEKKRLSNPQQKVELKCSH